MQNVNIYISSSYSRPLWAGSGSAMCWQVCFVEWFYGNAQNIPMINYIARIVQMQGQVSSGQSRLQCVNELPLRCTKSSWTKCPVDAEKYTESHPGRSPFHADVNIISIIIYELYCFCSQLPRFLPNAAGPTIQLSLVTVLQPATIVWIKALSANTVDSIAISTARGGVNNNESLMLLFSKCKVQSSQRGNSCSYRPISDSFGNVCVNWHLQDVSLVVNNNTQK